jgi:hypothetical protein
MSTSPHLADVSAALGLLSQQDRAQLAKAGYPMEQLLKCAADPEAADLVRGALVVHTVRFRNPSGEPSPADRQNAQILLALMDAPGKGRGATKSAAAAAADYRPSYRAARTQGGMLARWGGLFVVWAGLLIGTGFAQLESAGLGLVLAIVGFAVLAAYLTFFCFRGFNRPDYPVVVFAVMVLTYVGASFFTQSTYLSYRGKEATVPLTSASQTHPGGKSNAWKCDVQLPDGRIREADGCTSSLVGQPLSDTQTQVDVTGKTTRVVYDPSDMVAPQIGGKPGSPVALYFAGVGLVAMIVGAGMSSRRS